MRDLCLECCVIGGTETDTANANLYRFVVVAPQLSLRYRFARVAHRHVTYMHRSNDSFFDNLCEGVVNMLIVLPNR